MNASASSAVTSSEFRRIAREQLAGHWGAFALIYLVFIVVVGGIGAIPLVGSVAQLLISGPVYLGLVLCMLQLFRENTLCTERITDGFKTFLPAFLVHLLTSLYILLWSLLLIVPGIMAFYSYAMAYYILADNPGMTGSEAITASKEMMRGHRGALFRLHLSFIGWYLLSFLTLGIGLLWLSPYFSAASTAFYLNLKGTASTHEQGHWISEPQ